MEPRIAWERGVFSHLQDEIKELPEDLCKKKKKTKKNLVQIMGMVFNTVFSTVKMYRAGVCNAKRITINNKRSLYVRETKNLPA